MKKEQLLCPDFYDNGVVEEILYGKYMTFEFSATEDVMAKTDDVILKSSAGRD